MIGFRYNLPERLNRFCCDMWTFSNNISCTLLCTPFYNLTSPYAHVLRDQSMDVRFKRSSAGNP
jgi:hypothetical protein